MGHNDLEREVVCGIGDTVILAPARYLSSASGAGQWRGQSGIPCNGTLHLIGDGHTPGPADTCLTLHH